MKDFTLPWWALIPGILLMVYACSQAPKRYDSDPFTGNESLPAPEVKPPAFSAEDSSSTVEMDTFNQGEPSFEEVQPLDYFRPGTYTFDYIFDVRAASNISRMSGPNKYSMRIEILEEGSMHVMTPEEEPSKANLLLAPSGQDMRIDKPTTIFSYNLYYEVPHSMSFGKVEWVLAKLYIFDGQLRAVRVADHIYADRQVDLQIVKQTDLYTPSEENKPSSGTHVVRKGENLNRIAKKYGITVQELMSLNNLRNTTIYVGQKLKYAR